MISIAMATYNGAIFLKEQIDSILKQTIQDIEIVVCDDCSTDKTFDILQEYASKDFRFHIYQNEEKLGFKKNFEKAVSLCNGDYIALSDQDDIWKENHLELLLRAIKNKSLACGNSLLIDKDGKYLGMTLKYQESLDFIPEDNLKKVLSILLFRNPYQGASMMINNRLKEIALPIPDGVDYHDTWFASVACFLDGVNYIEEPILNYRRLPNSVTGFRENRKSKWKSFLHCGIFNDRFFIVSSILENKNIILSNKEKLFLNTIKKMCVRDKTLEGRIHNNLIKLLHYKTIYSCNLTHWI